MLLLVLIGASLLAACQFYFYSANISVGKPNFIPPKQTFGRMHYSITSIRSFWAVEPVTIRRIIQLTPALTRPEEIASDVTNAAQSSGLQTEDLDARAPSPILPNRVRPSQNTMFPPDQESSG